MFAKHDSRAHFGSTCTKTGTMQRRLARTLHREGTLNRKALHIWGDVKDSVGDIVNNFVITKCGASWVRKHQGEHFVKYVIV